MPHHANDGVIRLGPRIGEEHMLDAVGCNLHQLFRQPGSRLITGLEKGVVIGQPPHLFGGGVNQLFTAIADIDAPQPCHAVKNAIAVTVDDIMAVSIGDDPGAFAFHGTVICKRMQMMPDIRVR